MSIEFSWKFDTAGNLALASMFRRAGRTDRHNWSIGSALSCVEPASTCSSLSGRACLEWTAGFEQRGIAASMDRNLEALVPYALFENDEQLTRPFRTEREVWEAAEQADLITLGTHGEKILDNNFEIKSCEATAEELMTVPPDIVLPEARTSEPAPTTAANRKSQGSAHPSQGATDQDEVGSGAPNNDLSQASNR
ncbi:MULTISPECIES: hypothetical protein [unclassified Bradyrhizobium]|uniref:hypothetical protein n=1 Tax=unclassified Bradyrhizobium TaxID=2631580 RepID=UPI0028ED1A45|nr:MULTISPECIES: hypothetical protein [unclassified Bradyrhizobium]